MSTNVPAAPAPDPPAVALLTPGDTVSCGVLHLSWIYRGTNLPVTVYALNYTDPSDTVRPVITPVVIAKTIMLDQETIDWAPVLLSPGEYIVEMDGVINGRGFSSRTNSFAVGLGTDQSCLLAAPPPSPTPPTTGAPGPTNSPSGPGPAQNTAVQSTGGPGPAGSAEVTTVSPGVIVGSVLGGLVAVALFIVALLFCRRVRRPTRGTGGFSHGVSSKWGNLGSIDAHGAPFAPPPAVITPSHRLRHHGEDSYGPIMRPGTDSHIRSGTSAIDSDMDSIDEEKYWASTAAVAFPDSRRTSPQGDIIDTVAPLPYNATGGLAPSSSTPHYSKPLRHSVQSTSRNSRSSGGYPSAAYESDQRSPRRSDEDSTMMPRTGRRKPVPQYTATDLFTPEPVELPAVSSHHHHSQTSLNAKKSHPDLQHQSSFTFDKPVHYLMPDPPQSRS